MIPPYHEYTAPFAQLLTETLQTCKSCVARYRHAQLPLDFTSQYIIDYEPNVLAATQWTSSVSIQNKRRTHNTCMSPYGSSVLPISQS